MKQKEQIGRMIESEVRKQQISITEFAKELSCSRSTIYNMFENNKIDVLQLKRISKFLNRNFFEEIVKDLDIVSEIEETEEQREKRIAISNFLDIVPECLKQLGKSTMIVYGGTGIEMPVPDYGLTDAFISFTYGGTLKKRLGDYYNENLTLIKEVEYNGIVLEYIYNLVYRSIAINIEITNRTYEEWFEILKFAYSEYNRLTKPKLEI